VGRWLGSLIGGAGVIERAEEFFRGRSAISRTFKGDSKVSLNYRREDRQ
jgi:hypothetical protein